jgi:hypothetical protein
MTTEHQDEQQEREQLIRDDLRRLREQGTTQRFCNMHENIGLE